MESEESCTNEGVHIALVEGYKSTWNPREMILKKIVSYCKAFNKVKEIRTVYIQKWKSPNNPGN